MICEKLQNSRRRGAVAPLAALLAAFLLGMVSFALDVGYMVQVKGDLQNAADAAALAGVKPLMDGYVNYCLATTSTQQQSIMTAAMNSATAFAQNYASYNSAGGVSSLTLNSSDVQFGFTDASGNYTPLSGTSPYPNTIKVTMRRDSTANGSLSLYFAPVFGIKSVTLQVSAAATMYGGTPNSFNSNPNENLHVLPMTYDVNAWNNFLTTGLDPDGNQTVYNGYPAIQVYPSVKSPGNFGQLSLDDSHVGTPYETGWVNNGIGSTQIQALLNANLVPLSNHNNTLWDWQGDTGMKQSLVSAVNAQAGNQFIMPLFNPYNDGVPNSSSYSAGTGQGSNYYYQIVQFVGITIVPSNSGTVVVQPCAVVDANVIFGGSGPAPIGTSSASGLVTVFAAPKLTQ
jgi:Flp pilus assembly protein TadG